MVLYLRQTRILTELRERERERERQRQRQRQTDELDICKNCTKSAHQNVSDLCC